MGSLLRNGKNFPFSKTGMPVQISKKRKFVQDGVFKAELNEFLTRELAEDGYSGVEVRVTPSRTEIIILATRTQNVLGNKGQRIRELTSVVQKRFNYPDGAVELYAEKVATRGLCAIAQAESHRCVIITIRNIIENRRLSASWNCILGIRVKEFKTNKNTSVFQIRESFFFASIFRFVNRKIS